MLLYAVNFAMKIIRAGQYDLPFPQITAKTILAEN